MTLNEFMTNLSEKKREQNVEKERERHSDLLREKVMESQREIIRFHMDATRRELTKSNEMKDEQDGVSKLEIQRLRS